METHDHSTAYRTEYRPHPPRDEIWVQKWAFPCMSVGARICRRRRGVDLVRDLKSWAFRNIVVNLVPLMARRRMILETIWFSFVIFERAQQRNISQFGDGGKYWPR